MSFSCMAQNRFGIGQQNLSEQEAAAAAANQHLMYGVLHGITPAPSNFITGGDHQHGSAYDFGELEEALMPKMLHGVGITNDGDRKPFLVTRPPPTLEIFPSWPMRYQLPPRANSQSTESTDSGSAQNTGSGCRAADQVGQVELPETPMSKKAKDHHNSSSSYTNISSAVAVDHIILQQQNQQQIQQIQQQQVRPPEMASDASRTTTTQNQQKTTLDKKKDPGSSSEKRDGSRTLDAKTLRRLAQNREAARKSRLRKKAYVQQLETSKMKLNQLEQELQRARSQGLLIAGGGGGVNLSSDAAIFDMEHARWLEEDQRHMSELRAGLHAQLPDSDLRLIVDACLSHYDEIFRLKGGAAKSDVFHLFSGMWKTPAERCFLWMGGFRPSELLKIVLPQLEQYTQFTQQQVDAINSLEHSSQQAEDALSQGLQSLQQALADTIASGPLSQGPNVGNYMGQMAIALGKLANYEGFVRQADNLRQQTLHQLRRILTVRQAARCFLAIGEYYSRLRALSSLWVSRPRDSMLMEANAMVQTASDLQMVQVQPMMNHFTNH